MSRTGTKSSRKLAWRPHVNVSMMCELLCGNVRHHEECKHTSDRAAVTAKGDGKDPAPAATAKGDAEDPAPAETAKGDQRLQIAVMIRSDVFGDFRARKINSTLGLVEFFRVVNCAVAQHLADGPVALADLTEVLADVARTGFMSEPL